MEYQKITNLLENTPNQLSNFRTKKSIELNDDSQLNVIVKLNIKL